MITKKHMIRAAEIAATFQGVKHTAIVDAFVLFFREENPRFDEGRFRTACGAHQEIHAARKAFKAGKTSVGRKPFPGERVTVSHDGLTLIKGSKS